METGPAADDGDLSYLAVSLVLLLYLVTHRTQLPIRTTSFRRQAQLQMEIEEAERRRRDSWLAAEA